MTTVFTCRDDFTSMMTCVYTAWASRLGHSNVRLLLEPVTQQELFCTYVHVEPDMQKASSVITSIQKKISYEAYRWVYLSAMEQHTDRLDMIYRFLICGFYYGRKVTQMLTLPAVMNLQQLQRKCANEAHFFREVVRFSSVDERVFVSHIEPKCNVLDQVAEYFADRMPSEYWMIIDDIRHIAAVHPMETECHSRQERTFYLTNLTDTEWEILKKMELQKDMITTLWQEFFDTIGIEERQNERCQRTMLPLWIRKHMTEFQHKGS